MCFRFYFIVAEVLYRYAKGINFASEKIFIGIVTWLSLWQTKATEMSYFASVHFQKLHILYNCKRILASMRYYKPRGCWECLRYNGLGCLISVLKNPLNKSKGGQRFLIPFWPSYVFSVSFTLLSTFQYICRSRWHSGVSFSCCQFLFNYSYRKGHLEPFDSNVSCQFLYSFWVEVDKDMQDQRQ